MSIDDTYMADAAQELETTLNTPDVSFIKGEAVRRQRIRRTTGGLGALLLVVAIGAGVYRLADDDPSQLDTAQEQPTEQDPAVGAGSALQSLLVGRSWVILSREGISEPEESSGESLRFSEDLFVVNDCTVRVFDIVWTADGFTVTRPTPIDPEADSGAPAPCDNLLDGLASAQVSSGQEVSVKDNGDDTVTVSTGDWRLVIGRPPQQPAPTPGPETTTTEPGEAVRERSPFPLGWGFTSYIHTYSVSCGDGPYITDGSVTVWVDRGDPIVISGVPPLSIATIEVVQGFLAEAEDAGISSDVRLGEFDQPESVRIDWADGVDAQFCWESDEPVGSSSNGGGRRLVTPFDASVIDAETLDVSVLSCGGNPEVFVTETVDEVRLATVTTMIALGVEGDMCGDQVLVKLATALRDRSVIDALTGKPIDLIG